MLAGIFVILLFQLIGEVLQQYFQLVVPGPVIGLALLLLCLLVTRAVTGRGIFKIKNHVITAAEGLLSHLSLLFVPIGVGVIMHLQLLESQLLKVVVVILAGTLATMLFTAFVFARLVRGDHDE